MRVLFFGDLIGRVGREGLAIALPKLREHYDPSLVVVNAENAAAGKGMTPRIAQDLWELGVDVITMGNHTFDRKEIMSIIDDPRILRPANYPQGVQGKGWNIYHTREGVAVGVIQVMGRVYMPLTDNPFERLDQVLPAIRDQAKVILVDCHAEITSEKSAFGWFLDGRVSAVVGSHTHVQTADERILPGGTAYLTDAGACGPLNSIIGSEIEPAMKRFLTGLPQPLPVATGDAQICGVMIEVDEITGRARAIERIRQIVPLDTFQTEEK